MSPTLEGQAQAFARRISDSVSAFVGSPIPFSATASGSKFVVTDDQGGVVLQLGGAARLALEVNYRCELDSSGTYLKVLTSRVAIYAGARAKGDPLFRYEYVYNQVTGLPAAHLHLHAHRDQFTQVMTMASQQGARRREPKPGAEFEAARLANVHFPLGGHRFRPCLEDILRMLAEEFGVHTGSTWEQAERAARLEWRRQQSASVVRDCPSEATRVLRELGYVVQDPAEGPVVDNLERLLAL